MKLAEEKELCCGCTACESICPTGGGGHALTLKSDDEGFLYPHIDPEKCISCHACERACFYQSGKLVVADRLVQQQAFAVKAADESLRTVSQSGGAFGVLARQIIAQGGVIYGAAFDEAGVARHIRVTTAAGLQRIHGSKYVQSDLRGIFVQVKQDLTDGRRVLFSGTACQVMGLRKYLQRPYPDLVTVDIICYGVPSPLIWREVLSYLSRPEYGRLERVEHRAKDFGWHKCLMRLTYEHKTIVTDVWNRFWGPALATRPSCYECQFTNLERPGDLTVGDCWGAQEKMPEFDDNCGISLLLVNTQIGRNLYEAVQTGFTVRPIDIAEFMQPRLRVPTTRPAGREQFWRDHETMTTAAFIRRYAGLSLAQRIRRRLAGITFLRRIYHSLIRS